jgi:hypothetical protein
VKKTFHRSRCLTLFERPGGIRTPKQLDLALSLLDHDVAAGRISKSRAQVIRRAASLIRRAWDLEKLERRAKARGLGLRVLQGGLNPLKRGGP